jgi:thioredoxin-related protein
VAAFAAEHDVRYTIWMGDEALIEKFEVIAFPSYFVVDPEGEVVLEIIGESADLYKEVSALLPAAASPPAP